MPKRKILFCIYHLANGGAEKLLIDILREIDYDLFMVDLCVLINKGAYLDDIPEQVKQVNYSDFHLKEYDVEVAFSQGRSTREVALRKSNAVKIAWVHSDLLSAPPSRSYNYEGEEQLCYSIMDQIIFVSKTAMSQFCKKFPEVKGKKSVIYNLINKEEIIERSQVNIKKTKLTLCSIGRLVPVKGFVRLIPILAKLKSEGLDFHYWILGEGNQRRVIEDLIEEYHLEETVYLMGFQKNPYPYLNASDIFVSVSFYEGLPLVIGEALCLGKSVVATNVSGTAELLGYGKYGMLVNTDDESIYIGLREMIGSEKLRKFYNRKSVNVLKTNILDYKKNLNKINQLLYQTQSKKTFSEKVVQILIADNYINLNPGLLYGKMGKVIFLFHYSRSTGSKLYEDYAIRIIEEIGWLIQRNVDITYENGLAGIGTGLAYLVQNGFISNEKNEILSEFDELFKEVDFDISSSNFTLFNGYMGISRYWLWRLYNKNKNEEQENIVVLDILDKILKAVERPGVLNNVPDNELVDIYRFLCDLRKYSYYSDRVEKIISNEKIVKRIKIPLKLNYLEGESGKFIEERINSKYFETSKSSFSTDMEITPKSNPFFLNGIIAEGMCRLSLRDHNWQWINLL